MISEQTYKDLSIRLNAIRNDPSKQKEVAEIKKQQNDMFDELLDPEDKEPNTELPKKSILSKIKSIIKDKKKITEEKMNKHHIMSMWNSGSSDEEIIKKHGQKEFDKLKTKYGEKSIPASDLYGFKPTMDDAQKIHNGIIGPGAKLKQIIKQENSK